MNILIIGGGGFLGSHISDLCATQGWKVTTLDRSAPPNAASSPNIRHIQGSFLDADVLAKALVGTDAVIHLAHTRVPLTAASDPVADISENLIGTIGLMEAMRRADIRRLVYFSSGGTVYGRPETVPVTEHHAIRPIGAYGACKAAIENYIGVASSAWGLESCILRVSNPYGPRQSTSGVQGVIGSFMARLIENKPLEIVGDGSMIRDYIFVKDIAALCISVISSNAIGIYNAGSGLGTSLTELVSLMGRVTTKTINVKHLPSRPFDVPVNILDISRISKVTGWVPAYSIEQGLAETWLYNQANK